MKGKFVFSALFLVAIMAIMSFSGPVAADELVSGKTFLIANGDVFEPDINGFYTNYTNAGNTVINGSDMTLEDLQNKLTADVDALFFPANNLTGANLTFVKEWFDLGGKLLWVAGDSDYGSFFHSGDLNPVLEEVGSVLRLDAGAVDDPVSNDGASYRVVANQLGDGPIATEIKGHVGNDTFAMPFHGPTSVYYVKDGAPADLRNADLENVEVVVMSSADSKGIDQDLTAGPGDFYASINATGNLPMLAVESIGSNFVVVSGEAVFKDYKNMYGNTLEKAGTFHYGSIVVDTIISYIFEQSANESGLPINFFVPVAGLIAVAAIIRKRK